MDEKEFKKLLSDEYVNFRSCADYLNDNIVKKRKEGWYRVSDAKSYIRELAELMLKSEDMGEYRIISGVMIAIFVLELIENGEIEKADKIVDNLAKAGIWPFENCGDDDSEDEEDENTNDDDFEITDEEIEYNSNTNSISQFDNGIEELNSLIGLSEVKQEIRSLANFIRLNNARKERGIPTQALSYHLVFTGNPGTGKTTVARLLAHIFKELGILKSGHLVETDRSGLVAEYVGQTAVKTNKIIDNALDGVLFIDEAYTLAQGDNQDYGHEAIATLLKRMEDDRSRLIVILAGYGDEMKNFINSNPGLRSRFNRYINFPDYSAEELFQIFQTYLNKQQYSLSDEAETRIRLYIDRVVNARQNDFGNARFARNLFDLYG